MYLTCACTVQVIHANVLNTNLADCIKVLKDPLLESAWSELSLPLVAADVEEEAAVDFSSLLSSFKNPTEWMEKRKLGTE